MIPSKLQPKTSTITWSHQHSLKLFKTFLKEYYKSSKVIEENITSLRSLIINVLKNQPKA